MEAEVITGRWGEANDYGELYQLVIDSKVVDWAFGGVKYFNPFEIGQKMAKFMTNKGVKNTIY